MKNHVSEYILGIENLLSSALRSNNQKTSKDFTKEEQNRTVNETIKSCLELIQKLKEQKLL